MAYSQKQTSSNFINRNFLDSDCVITSAFETFSGRWTLQVLYSIHFGCNRFSLLKAQLTNISDHILGLRLNKLAKNGLIRKKDVDGEMVYVMTAKGKGLVKLLGELGKWHLR